jgi:histidine triad (HIT) family protein
MRKQWIILPVVLLTIGGIYLLSSKPSLPTGYCAFCDQSVLDRQTFYEDELVRALYTYKPVMPGHCLVIPKRHVERFESLTDEEITQMGQTLKKVNLAVAKVFDTSPYLLLQKNGVEVGQSVPHVHFHYIPRKTGDDSILKFLVKMYVENVKAPLPPDQIQVVVSQLEQAMLQ